jgi:hypothetical protein
MYQVHMPNGIKNCQRMSTVPATGAPLIGPTSVQDEPGVREFRKSTGTADPRRAKTVGARLIARRSVPSGTRFLQGRGPTPAVLSYSRGSS